MNEKCKQATSSLVSKCYKPFLLVTLLSINLAQFIYNVVCIAEMGGHYKSFLCIFHYLLDLIPGFILGCHVLYRTLKPNEPTSKPARILSLIIVGLYLLIAVLCLIFGIYASIKIGHYQNTRQHIYSFQHAAWWWIYYYGVLIFTPAWIFSVWYLCLPKAQFKDASQLLASLREDENGEDDQLAIDDTFSPTNNKSSRAWENDDNQYNQIGTIAASQYTNDAAYQDL